MRLFRHRFQYDCRRGPETAPATAHTDLAAVEFDKVFANREAKAEAAELTRYPTLALFKSLEERVLAADFNPNPRIGDGKVKIVLLVPSLNGDLATGPGEFDGIVNKVPKNLLEPDRVGPDIMLGRVPLGGDLECLPMDV